MRSTSRGNVDDDNRIACDAILSYAVYSPDVNGFLNRSMALRIVSAAVALGLTVGYPTSVGASSDHTSSISIRVSLDRTEVIAGRPIQVVVLITNSSKRPVVIQECGPVGWITIGIGNRRVPFLHVVPTSLCFGSFALKPGVTRFRVSVGTTYVVCSQVSPSRSPGEPVCLHPTSHPEMPPLPRGKYHTVFLAPGLPRGTATPAQIDVTLK
jgi:hypothetical protein